MLEAIRDFFLHHGIDKIYWLAFSGGVDSRVLLDLCCQIRSSFPLQLNAVHINHQLHPQAASWAKHCATVCQEYEVPFIEQIINIKNENAFSLEAIAREQRYGILADCIGENDILLTAHHQDDQAETLLLQLFRGAGVAGLSAMPTIKRFAKGYHARPLLAFSRSKINDYAKQHQLSWIEDTSNLNTTFTRNFIRHDVLTLVKSRWPSITETIARSASHCAEANELLEHFLFDIYQECKGSIENTLSVKKLLNIDLSKRKFVLRYWMKQFIDYLPNEKKLNTILNDVLNANQDRMPCVKWKNVALRRYRDDLYLTCESLFSHPDKINWDLKSPVDLQGVGRLYAVLVQGQGLVSSIDSVSIAFRKHTNRSLKKNFQSAHIPPWERERTPLIFIGEQLAAIPGYFTNRMYSAKK
ncbi:MAG: tRNA lysidine(34) synthetase TilS, partial [Gammaproteobacteria bacterium RIFCSPHIGHO2_12_FULL_38_11]